VLAIIKAKDFDDALRIANSTEYGLTGSVYSRDRARLDHAADEFHVGNLYFNRKSTGALVGATTSCSSCNPRASVRKSS